MLHLRSVPAEAFHVGVGTRGLSRSVAPEQRGCKSEEGSARRGSLGIAALEVRRASCGRTRRRFRIRGKRTVRERYARR